MYEARVDGRTNDGWGGQVVGVYRGDERVCEFRRNYPSFGAETFAPFRRGERWYALYSPHYTALRVTELPSGRDVGGEGPSPHGFCPTQVHVPRYQLAEYVKGELTMENEEDCFEDGKETFHAWFALVAGCVWGDDGSDKLQVRDLSLAHEGVLTAIDVGYVEMGRDADVRKFTYYFFDASHVRFEFPTFSVLDVNLERKTGRVMR